jgi:uncharacterized damage-inducible protein DinB
MNITDGFVAQFGYNLRAFERLVDGINHEESMIAPQFGGNTINWIVGHLVQSRNEMLEVIGLAPIWTAAIQMKYQTGSKPISNPDNIGVDFDRLLTDYRAAQDLLLVRIAEMTEEELNQEIGEGEQKTTIAATVNGYIWHETYHIGQIELLRPMVGKMDEVF